MLNENHFRCGALLGSFSQQCADCISLQLPTLGSGGSLDLCATDPADFYTTTYGLMLLSRKELKDTRAFPFSPESQLRGYLEATVSLQFTIVMCLLIFLLAYCRWMALEQLCALI